MSTDPDILLSQINEALKEEIASRHSYFQLRYFLIGKEPTMQAKMWQCLRELKTRKESLDAIDLEIEETKDKIALLDINIRSTILDKNSHSYDGMCGLYGNYLEEDKVAQKLLFQEESDIKIRQANRQIKAGESSLLGLTEKKKWLLEECQFFLQTFVNLKALEPLKNFDDLESQKQYWGEKLSQKINLKMLVTNQLDTEMVETLMALPDDMQVKKQIISLLNNRHAQMVEKIEAAKREEKPVPPEIQLIREDQRPKG